MIKRLKGLPKIKLGFIPRFKGGKTGKLSKAFSKRVVLTGVREN